MQTVHSTKPSTTTQKGAHWVDKQPYQTVCPGKTEQDLGKEWLGVTEGVGGGTAWFNLDGFLEMTT